ncbi:MAG: RNA 3'-phosphate cyclase [Candidatus Brocadiae bacterium]|nr:RNA 3'-phosphate cyclase [Candidatus Brocadiia bacterium]
MWHVDGGVGGGQIVRTAVAVAALRGIPVSVSNIRRDRGNPGLQRQHLASILAVEMISGGRLTGAIRGSAACTFTPGAATGPVRERIDIGTAGSTLLVLQAVLPILVRRGGTFLATGGTDNPMAPPVDWAREILLPALAPMGISAGIELVRRGFCPAGGGEILASSPATPAWSGLTRTRWGPLAAVRGIAYANNLPSHVPERIRHAALKELRSGKGLSADEKGRLRESEIDVRIERGEGPSAGAGIVLWAEDDAGVRIGASALGELKKPSEEVGREAGSWMLAELAAGAPVDRHLADQLLLWCALASGPSEFRTGVVTEHLRSCAHLLEDAEAAAIAIDGDGPAIVRVVPRPA